MKLSNYISSCRNPICVKHRGVAYSVGCGRCVDCYTKRSRYYTDMCQQAHDTYKYHYFYTLTYRNSDCPTARFELEYDPQDLIEIIDPEPIKVKLVDCTHRYYKNGKPRPYKLSGVTLKSDYDTSLLQNPLFREFYKKSHSRVVDVKGDKKIIPGSLPSPDEAWTLRYCSMPDLQNHLKRLRDRIRRLYDTEISFFAVSEYGPQTFRPHFHVSLFFDDERLATSIEGIVRKSWQYGDVRRPEFARTSSGCVSYVASYINSYACLPVYLDSPLLRPRNSHSIRLGSRLTPFLREYVYSHPETAHSKNDIAIGERIVTYYPSGFMQRTLYPRCYNYELQSDSDRYKLYTGFETFARRYGTSNCNELTYRILNNSTKYTERRFLRLLDLINEDELPQCSSSSALVKSNSVIFPGVFCTLRSDFEAYDSLIFNRVYFQLVQSRYFLTQCCVGRSSTEVLGIINDFYRRRPLEQLSLMYAAMEEYNKQTGSTDYTLFFPLKNEKSNSAYRKAYVGSSYISYINNQKDFEATKYIKHKELNDLNMIWVAPPT